MANAALAAAQTLALSSAVTGVMGEALSPLYREIQATANTIMPNLNPPINDLISALNGRWIKGNAVEELLWSQGVYLGDAAKNRLVIMTEFDKLRQEAWQAIRHASRPLPSISEIRESLNRGLIDETEAKLLFGHHGYLQHNIEKIITPLRSAIPGASDLVRFAVREVWNSKVVKQFGYDAEFPAEFNAWMKTLGYVDDPRVVGGKGFPSNLESWAQAYWRAHWDIISPTQAYVALQRLRIDSVTGTWRSPSGVVFDENDLDTVLKIHDYPPYFRKVLAAISYRVLTRVDIRRAYRIGTIKSKAELVEYYKDTGYNDREAGVLADITIAEYQPKAKVVRQQATKGTICRLYSAGVMTRDAALVSLHSVNTNTEKELEEYRQRNPDEQLKIAEQDFAAREFLEICDLQAEEKLVSASLRAIKKRYMIADFNDSDAKSELVKLGISQDMISRYLKHWHISRNIEHKYSMTDLAIRHYCKGYLSERQYERRLVNLGWTRDEWEQFQFPKRCEPAGATDADAGDLFRSQTGPANGQIK